MQEVIPKSYVVGQTEVFPDQLKAYLASVCDQHTDSMEMGAAALDHAYDELIYNLRESSGAEALCAFMGRMCYRSFYPNLNPNVSKVREGIKEYMLNILKSGHGSVLEHGSVSVLFHNVSRVFTHEMVRHRAGCAMSQESLRYVRLDNLGLWLPPEIKADPNLAGLFRTTFENLEQLQAKMSDYLGFEGETEEAHYRRFIETVLDPGVKLDPFDDRLNLTYLGAENEEAYRKWAESNPAKKPIGDFAVKKAYTSAMRRLAPDGLATSIGFTGNFRAWRHILAMRSSPHAEVEMRAVMVPLAVKFRGHFPAVFQDMEIKYKGNPVPLEPTSEFLTPFCADLAEHAEEYFMDYEVSFKYPKV